MRTFVKPIPANNNTAGGGSPYNDMVKAIEAVVEIRSNVPSLPQEVNAADMSSLQTLLDQFNRLELLMTGWSA